MVEEVVMKEGGVRVRGWVSGRWVNGDWSGFLFQEGERVSRVMGEMDRRGRGWTRVRGVVVNKPF